MLTWILSKVRGININWRLTGIAIGVALLGTSLYACTWEKTKVAVKAEQVQQARQQLEVLEKHVQRSAIEVQEASQEASKRVREVDNAIQKSGDWGDAPVPDAVRNELCATINCGEAGEVPAPGGGG